MKKPVGSVTRGTTNQNRLRRVDHWIAANLAHRLRVAADPIVVDLGFGASPITTAELRFRLARIRPEVRVVGLEIDPDRVRRASTAADPPWLEFRHGGFELAGLRPIVVRALNVLRQYDEDEVRAAWAMMTGRLADGGVLVEGTCDELGRISCWVAVPAGREVPSTLTLAADLAHLDRPTRFAERLPKVLIHHNVPGEPIHALLAGLDTAWLAEAPYAPFGPRQRFARAVAALRDAGWPVVRDPRRWRQGQFSLAWSALVPP
jgi:hypothetical protein